MSDQEPTQPVVQQPNVSDEKQQQQQQQTHTSSREMDYNQSSLSSSNLNNLQKFKLPSVDLDDIFKMRESIAEMDRHVFDSKVPFQKHPKEFRQRYDELEAKVEEANSSHINYVIELEKKAGLPSMYAKSFRNVINDNSIPEHEQRPIVAYTAASSSAYNKKVEENKKIFEELKQSNSKLDQWKQENERLSRDLEEFKRVKTIKEPTQFSYDNRNNSNSQKSKIQVDDEEESPRSLLSSFSTKTKVIRQEPINSWMQNLIPKNDDIYTAPVDYNTNDQGVNQCKLLSDYMMKHFSNPTLHSAYGGSNPQYNKFK